MIFSRAWFAIMRRNVIYRRRNAFGTFLELALPVAFVGILLGIKKAVENTSGFKPTVVEPYYPAEQNAFIPFTFTDYVTSLQAKRQCVNAITTDFSGVAHQYDISGMPDYTYDWQVPMIKCDPRSCSQYGEDAWKFCEVSIVALAGEDDVGKARAEAMKSYIYSRWPVLLDRKAIPVDYDLVQIFDSSSAIGDYVQNENYGKTGFPKIAMGIVWDAGNTEKNYLYTLRQNSTNYNNPTSSAQPAITTTPNTADSFDSYAKDDETACAGTGGEPDQGPLDTSCTGLYMYNGVLTFQRLVGDFILYDSGAEAKGYFVADAGVRYVPFPSPSYTEEGFYGAIQAFAPLMVVLGLLYPVASWIGYITKEKELRQKELMKMMSVSESDINWGWFMTFFLFNIVTGTITSIVASQLYSNSDGFLMWIFWMFTFVAMIVFTMALGALTSKTTRGILISLLVVLIGYFVAIATDFQTLDSGLLGLISLHPVAAFSYGLQEIGYLEDLGVGITKDSIGNTDNKSGYTFQMTLNSLAADAIIWGILTWYLNRVIQPDYGQAQPLWFPFTASYWCPSKAAPVHGEGEENNQNPAEVPIEPVGDELSRQTADGTNIVIKNLTKIFGEHTAVDGLNLTMYNGQITALLGHNGAGKTTTIGMLTGALGPTSGTATVCGNDIRTQMTMIRQDIGICLQHDCLFPHLTVREHVQFFSRLKGLYSKVSYEEAEAHVDQAIQDVALMEKRNTLSKNLSGGMKRKLSVAMAFCGGSKVVLLDEPTSGMDPFSRRFTWNVIRQYRRDRCIILTTHFMDEADILGDRIAIMAEGQLRCSGSALFLKKTYGVGYQLTIEKLKKDKDIGGSVHESRIDDNDRKLMELVTSAVPEATMLTNVGSALSYQLPMGAASKFGPMLEGLDEEVNKGTVGSYGVSVTTLDEVFLLVARGDSKDKKEFASSKRGSSMQIDADDTKSYRSRMDLEKEGLFLRHVGALFKKRAAFFRRDKKAWICTTLVPSLFVLGGFIIFKVAAPERNLEPITLDLANFNSGVTNGPKNPIAYNSPDNPYTCQPGMCGYMFDVMESDETSELYYYCGMQAYINGSANCSISESTAIAEQLNDDGADGMQAMVNDVLDSSYSLGNTSSLYEATQYGAIFFTHDQTSTLVGNGSLYSESVEELCLEASSYGNYSPFEDCKRFGGIGYVIQYNFTALHVSPLYQAVADEALVREATKDKDFTIQCTIAPLPITAVEETFGKAQDAFTAWFLVVLSFPFIGGAFASFIVTERESKAKHLQTVAGVEPTAYWLSTFLWDIINYQIPLWITIALMFAFNVDVMTTTKGDVFGGVLVTLLLYGPASAGFAYCVSFGFKSPSMCNIVLIISGFLIGMGGPLAIFILRIIGKDPTNPKQNLVNAANIVAWCLRWIPTFCLGEGIFSAINLESYQYWASEDISVWNKDVLGLEVLCLVLQSVVYIGLAIFLDVESTNPRIMKVWKDIVKIITCQALFGSNRAGFDITVALPDDDDVIAEQDRVLAGEANEDLIVISQLTKIYDTGKVAVNNLSLGIAPGECFGLLGINGAGKTTTMGMLTAEFPPTSGDATLAGFSVTNEPSKTRRRIGYCPQFDAHFANLTGREHVELYASIKGVPLAFVKEAAADKLHEVGLSEFDSDRLSAGYSGGMKRRLSLACATIGQPQILFLDECSTGVDPVARREIWQLISDMVTNEKIPEAERTSVILTTHSMEECEALCPRIGIMANGRLRCLGSAQHLKNKFGQGYQLEIKVQILDRQDDDYVANMETLLSAKGGSVSDDMLFNLDETLVALRALTGDNYLADMINVNNPSGYNIWKDATANGVPLETLDAFATMEMRMRNVEIFMKQTYPSHVLRERQDTKARYEVSSQGIRLSSLFKTIEENKDKLRLSDYGVSQTSLEQVFNMHAAEAEKLKQGRNDG